MADMGQITESLLGGLKSVFSDVAEDEFCRYEVLSVDNMRITRVKIQKR